ncbi:hypothetical protein SCLCIDRAFT_1207853 [Scleroderma citrinum Foug A]|uniref:Uncharacterized protein n=1 Tax=Scleroderma citrinum Foug A TaxID=1036808 RepID=A0A0C3ENK3_9AGAM|nr:hypothetical protein SCLCIDRAFT_1207853 [Scleroderma citrinum Foug A]
MWSRVLGWAAALLEACRWRPKFMSKLRRIHVNDNTNQNSLAAGTVPGKCPPG